MWVDVPGSTFVPARHGFAAFVELASIAWRLRRLEPEERPEVAVVRTAGRPRCSSLVEV